MFSKLAHWICKHTGHWFSSTDILIFQIKTNALNQDYRATLTCRCCGEVFVHRNTPQ